ncbi:hypothetical protein N656DRAFT_91895 [Canariomyces notabilis]|uniref:Secreted protein n=1 Tax=Canariomyces notabilis TaxID=2074819 RepID=A0AAN6TDM2_9PEZI|nr:hypothetical protein N656DRAFT_91895 [Canariomyces arenarius]
MNAHFGSCLRRSWKNALAAVHLVVVLLMSSSQIDASSSFAQSRLKLLYTPFFVVRSLVQPVIVTYHIHCYNFLIFMYMLETI